MPHHDPALSQPQDHQAFGPWSVSEVRTSTNELAFHTIDDTAGRPIASTWAGPHAANAHLIAAAPALLAFARRTLARMYGERVCFLECHTVCGDTSTLDPEDAQHLQAIDKDIAGLVDLIDNAQHGAIPMPLVSPMPWAAAKLAEKESQQ